MPLARDRFPQRTQHALQQAAQQAAVSDSLNHLRAKRQRAVGNLPEFETLRDQAAHIKEHSLNHLDYYLERFETKAQEAGSQVHWGRTGLEVCQIVLAICQQHGVQKIIKSKSMVSEEIALNHFLEQHGITPLETDLGEYIVQARGEPPSHIVAPALHLSTNDVINTFRAHHQHLPADRNLPDENALLAEARQLLRQEFLQAQVGITGANLLVAETGSALTVTNEGNADLIQVLPPIHIIITGLEKVVPTLEDATTILRVLARSATGQDCTTYTTFSTGTRRPNEQDGPRSCHIILLDNGRTQLLASRWREILRCIRCGACLNHCPVYGAIGGHAYDSVYPGPLGAVLTPALRGLSSNFHLPNASTFCGRCEQVCPVKIQLPKLMRYWREEAFFQQVNSRLERWGVLIWAQLAKRTWLYRPVTKMAAALLCLLGGRSRRLPTSFATHNRYLPAPTGQTFVHQWHRRRARKRRN